MLHVSYYTILHDNTSYSLYFTILDHMMAIWIAFSILYHIFKPCVYNISPNGSRGHGGDGAALFSAPRLLEDGRLVGLQKGIWGFVGFWVLGIWGLGFLACNQRHT